MVSVKEKKHTDLKIEIGTEQPTHWGEKEIAEIKAQAKGNAQKRSSAQKIKNELNALQYELEEYLADTSASAKPLHLEKVVSIYLSILDLSFRKFAICLDITDSNLKKYLTGERKFNIDLAMKFGHFFHTSPELWLRLELKNELSQLRKERAHIKHYTKYDYRKAIGIA